VRHAGRLTHVDSPVAQNQKTAPSVDALRVIVDAGAVGDVGTRLLTVGHSVRRRRPNAVVHVTLAVHRPRVLVSYANGSGCS